jgi:hypothetical protein
MRLRHASAADVRYLRTVVNDISQRFGPRFEATGTNTLDLT